MSLIEIYFKLFFQAETPIIYSFPAFNSILIKIIFIIGVAYLGQIILNALININKRQTAGEKMKTNKITFNSQKGFKNKYNSSNTARSEAMLCFAEMTIEELESIISMAKRFKKEIS